MPGGYGDGSATLASRPRDRTLGGVYRTLKADQVIETAEAIRRRVAERFPQSSLAAVAAELCAVARGAEETSAEIARPNWPLRIGVAAVIAVIGAALIGGIILARQQAQMTWGLSDLVEMVEAGINDVLLIGAAVFFLVTAEARMKRRRALRAIHELRSLAHIIDMHQLTKDPERLLLGGDDTASSPERRMTPFELSRYLDYCSEMLSVIGKVAALYAQHFDDGPALEAVDEIEDLTTGLSRKIWQKMMILNATK